MYRQACVPVELFYFCTRGGAFVSVSVLLWVTCRVKEYSAESTALILRKVRRSGDRVPAALGRAGSCERFLTLLRVAAYDPRLARQMKNVYFEYINTAAPHPPFRYLYISLSIIARPDEPRSPRTSRLTFRASRPSVAPNEQPVKFASAACARRPCRRGGNERGNLAGGASPREKRPRVLGPARSCTNCSGTRNEESERE